MEFVIILSSDVNVHTLGVPAIKTYDLLLSLVSYHTEPTAFVTAGASSCLNISGFPETVDVNISTDVVVANLSDAVVVITLSANASDIVTEPSEANVPKLLPKLVTYELVANLADAVVVITLLAKASESEVKLPAASKVPKLEPKLVT